MAFFLSYQAWYRQNLQVSIPVSIVAGIVVLLILFALLKCVKRCCCGRSKPKVVPNPPIATAIPSNVSGQRIPSWSSLQNNGNDVGRDRDGRRDSAQPFMFNSVPPPRSYSPAFNGNGRRSDDTAPMLYQNPFEPERASQVPAALRPGGSSRTPRLPEPSYEPSYPLPPAAPRQSTWGGNANIAGVGSSGRYPGSGSGSGSVSGPSPGPRPRQNRSSWVDERMYNGPRS
jgi:hypothetical protein